MGRLNLTIEIPKSASKEYNDLQERLEKLNLESSKLKPIKDLFDNTQTPKKLGSGSSSIIYEGDKKSIIRSSDCFSPLRLIKITNSPDSIKSTEEIINRALCECDNIKLYCSLYKYFPYNIIRMYSHKKYYKEPYFNNVYIMDRVFGTTLDNYIKSEKNLCNIYNIIIQILYITLYTGNIGIFHGDLKADNIMIENSELSSINYNCIDFLEITLKGHNIPIVKMVDYSLAVKTKKERMPLEFNTAIYMLCDLLSENKKIVDELKSLKINTSYLLLNASPVSVYNDLPSYDAFDYKNLCNKFKTFIQNNLCKK